MFVVHCSHTANFSGLTSSVQLMPSLKTDIPSSVTVTLLHSGSIAMTTSTNEVSTTGNTTTLAIVAI